MIVGTKVQRFDQKLRSLKNGSYDVFYRDERYLLSKETHLDGKVIKLYAKSLGGRDFISLNYYVGKEKSLLKPCEMAEEKVVDFVLNLRV